MSIRDRLDKMETFLDTKEVTVLDCGTGYCKAGFAGEDIPRTVMPTVMSTKIREPDAGAHAELQKSVAERTEKDYGNEKTSLFLY